MFQAPPTNMERRASLGVAALEKLGGTLGVRRASQVASAVNHQGARWEHLLMRETLLVFIFPNKFSTLYFSVSRTWLGVQ